MCICILRFLENATPGQGGEGAVGGEIRVGEKGLTTGRSSMREVAHKESTACNNGGKGGRPCGAIRKNYVRPCLPKRALTVLTRATFHYSANSTRRTRVLLSLLLGVCVCARGKGVKWRGWK